VRVRVCVCGILLNSYCVNIYRDSTVFTIHVCFCFYNKDDMFLRARDSKEYYFIDSGALD